MSEIKYKPLLDKTTLTTWQLLQKNGEISRAIDESFYDNLNQFLNRSYGYDISISKEAEHDFAYKTFRELGRVYIIGLKILSLKLNENNYKKILFEIDTCSTTYSIAQFEKFQICNNIDIFEKVGNDDALEIMQLTSNINTLYFKLGKIINS